MAKTTSTAKSAAGSKQAASQNNESKLLNKFFVDGLKDIYWAEKNLVKALTKMGKKATSEELKNAFEKHRTQTEEQVKRLEQVFDIIGTKAVAKKCEAMEGLIKEANEIIEQTEDNTMTRDAALIIAAQKAEHYEIASYGGLAQLAKTLGKNDAANILAQTLQEEKDTDELLTQIAERNINVEAAQETE
ncbi:ferritin-like domain-containing protein [Ilyomonas limi]|uniref:Ferritin-like domain-containing protein n=1 Tax=Ilyomonas limi TaxID=2575867 RepID=A0A4U3KTI7_9BACT|nr:ferritin-like domain-containing protein [Ilyomonas limi]TKK65661.1 ferritin-like domain-containing protein [Ilyomonas limi]